MSYLHEFGARWLRLTDVNLARRAITIKLGPVDVAAVGRAPHSGEGVVLVIDVVVPLGLGHGLREPRGHVGVLALEEVTLAGVDESAASVARGRHLDLNGGHV